MPEAIRFQDSRMSEDFLVRFDEEEVGVALRGPPFSLLLHRLSDSYLLPNKTTTIMYSVSTQRKSFPARKRISTLVVRKLTPAPEWVSNTEFLAHRRLRFY